MKHTLRLAAAAVFLACGAAFGQGNRTAEKKTPPAAVAKSSSASYAEEVMGKLAAWDTALSSLKSGFTQTVIFSDAGLKETVEGTLSYLKPDKLRIEHLSPSRQIIVTDKKDLWIYKPADSQAVKTRWEDWKNLQNSGFSGLLDFGNYAALTAKNSISAVPPRGAEGLIKLVLSPADRSGRYTLTLLLSATDYFPAEADLTVDSARIRTRLHGTERNSELSPDLFQFTPPKGTEILNFKK